MTTSANQLIAKALSTTSEDEAIACLRMARKRGARMVGDTSTKASSHSQYDIEKLKQACRSWEGLYKMADYDRMQWRGRYYDTRKELDKSQARLTAMIILFSLSFITVFFMGVTLIFN